MQRCVKGCNSFLFSLLIDASSSDEGSSNFTSLDNKYKRTTSKPNGQTSFTLALNVGKARLAIFPVSEVRHLGSYSWINLHRSKESCGKSLRSSLKHNRCFSQPFTVAQCKSAVVLPISLWNLFDKKGDPSKVKDFDHVVRHFCSTQYDKRSVGNTVHVTVISSLSNYFTAFHRPKTVLATVGQHCFSTTIVYPATNIYWNSPGQFPFDLQAQSVEQRWSNQRGAGSPSHWAWANIFFI